MRKLLLCGLLVAGMSVALVGCGGSSSKKDDTKVEASVSYADSLEILTKVWDGFAEDAKFPCFGGSMAQSVDNAPGALDLSDTDSMTNVFIIPEDVQAKIKDAATLVHMMNSNTFTSAVLKMDGMSAKDAAEKIEAAFQANQFMCGMPEKIITFTAGDYVIYAYGEASYTDDFKAQAEKLDGVSLVAYNDKTME